MRKAVLPGDETKRREQQGRQAVSVWPQYVVAPRNIEGNEAYSTPVPFDSAQGEPLSTPLKGTEQSIVP